MSFSGLSGAPRFRAPDFGEPKTQPWAKARRAQDRRQGRERGRRGGTESFDVDLAVTKERACGSGWCVVVISARAWRGFSCHYSTDQCASPSHPVAGDPESPFGRRSARAMIDHRSADLTLLRPEVAEQLFLDERDRVIALNRRFSPPRSRARLETRGSQGLLNKEMNSNFKLLWAHQTTGRSRRKVGARCVKNAVKKRRRSGCAGRD